MHDKVGRRLRLHGTRARGELYASDVSGELRWCRGHQEEVAPQHPSLRGFLPRNPGRVYGDAPNQASHPASHRWEAEREAQTNKARTLLMSLTLALILVVGLAMPAGAAGNGGGFPCADPAGAASSGGGPQSAAARVRCYTLTPAQCAVALGRPAPFGCTVCFRGPSPRAQ